MANPEHLAKLKEGVEAWNQWRKDNLYIKPRLSNADLNGARLYRANLNNADLLGANLSGAYLLGAKLTNADLRYAKLKHTELYGANLEGANLFKANLLGANLKHVDFSHANLGSTHLRNANFRSAILYGANLESANLRNADFASASLRNANLASAYLINTKVYQTTEIDPKWRKVWEIINQGAIGQDLTAIDLSDANLEGANLSGANLEGANLEGATLNKVQFLKTNFSGATLTGACIEDWHTNSKTKLENVQCDYIFLKRTYSKEKKKVIFTDRRPHDPDKSFAPNEFAKLFQKAFETIDLFFQNGADWQAVAYSLDKVRVENENTLLRVKAIEDKGDGDVLISVIVPQTVDKAKIEGDFWQGYEFAQKQLEGQFQARIDDKDKVINNLFSTVRQLQDKVGNTYIIEGSAGIVHNENSNISGDAKIAGELNENPNPQD